MLILPNDVIFYLRSRLFFFHLFYCYKSQFNFIFMLDSTAMIPSIFVKGQMFGVQSNILLLKMPREAWADFAQQRRNFAREKSTKMRTVQWTSIFEFCVAKRFSIYFALVRMSFAIALQKVSNGKCRFRIHFLVWPLDPSKRMNKMSRNLIIIFRDSSLFWFYRFN